MCLQRPLSRPDENTTKPSSSYKRSFHVTVNVERPADVAGRIKAACKGCTKKGKEVKGTLASR